MQWGVHRIGRHTHTHNKQCPNLIFSISRYDVFLSRRTDTDIRTRWNRTHLQRTWPLHIVTASRPRTNGYQKLYAWVTHIWGNRKGQPDRIAMKGPHLERTASLITVPSASGKYDLFWPSLTPHYRACALIPYGASLSVDLSLAHSRPCLCVCGNNNKPPG